MHHQRLRSAVSGRFLGCFGQCTASLKCVPFRTIRNPAEYTGYGVSLFRTKTSESLFFIDHRACDNGFWDIFMDKIAGTGYKVIIKGNTSLPDGQFPIR